MNPVELIWALQEYLTGLWDGFQSQIVRTTAVESSLTILRFIVTRLESHLHDQVNSLSTTHKLKHQQLNQRIRHLDTQVQTFHRFVSTQISELIVSSFHDTCLPPPQRHTVIIQTKYSD